LTRKKVPRDDAVIAENDCIHDDDCNSHDEFLREDIHDGDNNNLHDEDLHEEKSGRAPEVSSIHLLLVLGTLLPELQQQLSKRKRRKRAPRNVICDEDDDHNCSLNTAEGSDVVVAEVGFVM